MARQRVKRTDCPNCGRSLLAADNYCPSCGQENHTHKLPVRHFIVELLSGLFNFDTKLIRTLRDLFWPPGLVIREFNANKRARYVHPLRLYLFTSVVFFLTLAWTTSRLEIGTNDVVAIHRSEQKDPAPQGLTLNLGEGEGISDSVLTALSRRRDLTDPAIDSALVAAGIEPGFWSRIVVRMGLNASTSSSRKAAYVQSMFGAFSKLMFVLLPLFAGILYLLHAGSGRFYTEHLIFALYYHAVLFLLITVRLLAGQFVDGLSDIGLPVIVALVLLFWSVRTAYETSWLATILRTVVLILLYFILLVLGFASAAVIGAL